MKRGVASPKKKKKNRPVSQKMKPVFQVSSKKSLKSRRRLRQSSGRNTKKTSRSLWGRFVKGLLLVSLWIFMGMGLFVGYCAYDLPKLDVLIQGKRKQSIIVTSACGEVLCRYGESQNPVMRLEEVSPFLLQSIMAIEDRRFYDHDGVDFYGLIRALSMNVVHGGIVQGGSTLTQQLAKTLFLGRQRTIKRKVQELLLSFWLEKRFSKRELFLIYLNRVYWGAGAYGVGAASLSYFNKKPKDLSLYESALLAGMLKAPSSLSPFSSGNKAHKRALLVLSALQDMKMITKTQKAQAVQEAFSVDTLVSRRQGVRYFGDWVVQEAHKLLGDKLQGDVTIESTLDGQLQSKVASRLESALTSSFGPESSQEGAVLVLNYEGAIQAMVGGKSYGESQFNRATQAKRQPGSLFKVVVFLEALFQGITPGTLISDGPIRIGSWAPKNTHWQSQGMVSVSTAFQKSINTATVRLAQRVGLKKLHHRARLLGIQTPLPSDLTIALGTGEVTLLEMTTAMGRIASGSETFTPYGIRRIEEAKGKVLYDRHVLRAGGEIPFPYTQMRQMLIQVVDQGTGHNAGIHGRVVGGKTGTSQNKKDALFVGFTPSHIGGVWVGYEGNVKDKNNKTMGTMGGKFPARLFREILG